MMNLEEKLNELAGMKLAYAASKAEWEVQTAEAKERIDDLEKEISEAVLAEGKTVKTDLISAIWNKGKSTWDGKLLEGYAVAHPEILAAKKVGKPTVSFRLAAK